MGRTRSRENREELDQLPIPSQIPFKKWENQYNAIKKLNKVYGTRVVVFHLVPNRYTKCCMYKNSLTREQQFYRSSSKLYSKFQLFVYKLKYLHNKNKITLIKIGYLFD
jgi:hypothetical protein